MLYTAREKTPPITILGPSAKAELEAPMIEPPTCNKPLLSACTLHGYSPPSKLLLYTYRPTSSLHTLALISYSLISSLSEKHFT